MCISNLTTLKGAHFVSPTGQGGTGQRYTHRQEGNSPISNISKGRVESSELRNEDRFLQKFRNASPTMDIIPLAVLIHKPSFRTKFWWGPYCS